MICRSTGFSGLKLAPDQTKEDSLHEDSFKAKATAQRLLPLSNGSSIMTEVNFTPSEYRSLIWSGLIEFVHWLSGDHLSGGTPAKIAKSLQLCLPSREFRSSHETALVRCNPVLALGGIYGLPFQDMDHCKTCLTSLTSYESPAVVMTISTRSHGTSIAPVLGILENFIFRRRTVSSHFLGGIPIPPNPKLGANAQIEVRASLMPRKRRHRLPADFEFHMPVLAMLSVLAREWHIRGRSRQ